MPFLNRKPHVDRFPERVFLHSKYDDETMDFDLALIKISPVEITSHITPIALPDPKECRKKRRKRRKTGKRTQRSTRKRIKAKILKGNENRRSKRRRIKRKSKRTRIIENREYSEKDSEEEDEGWCNMEKEREKRNLW